MTINEIVLSCKSMSWCIDAIEWIDLTLTAITKSKTFWNTIEDLSVFLNQIPAVFLTETGILMMVTSPFVVVGWLRGLINGKGLIPISIALTTLFGFYAFFHNEDFLTMGVFDGAIWIATVCFQHFYLKRLSAKRLPTNAKKL